MWSLFLQGFSFSCTYRPGRELENADGLSRQNWLGTNDSNGDAIEVTRQSSSQPDSLSSCDTGEETGSPRKLVKLVP